MVANNIPCSLWIQFFLFVYRVGHSTTCLKMHFQEISIANLFEIDYPRYPHLVRILEHTTRYL